MINNDVYVNLKDGFTVVRKHLTLNLDKERRYIIYYKDRRMVSNLKYCEVQNYLKYLREDWLFFKLY